MEIIHDPNTLTKEELVHELEKHGVQMPSAKLKQIKKAQLTQLYTDNILKKQTVNGEKGLTLFSSDEELAVSEIESVKKSKKVKKSPRKSVKSKVLDKTMEPEEDVTDLSDNELIKQLRVLGAEIGPITDSTRRVYQRKLQKLLIEGPEEPKEIQSNDLHNHGDTTEEESHGAEFSADDSEDEIDSNGRLYDQHAPEDKYSNITRTVTSQKQTIVRQRVTNNYADREHTPQVNREHTPIIQPRTAEQLTSTPIANSLPTSAHEQLRRAREDIRKDYAQKSETPAKSSFRSMLCVGGVLFVLVVVLFVIIQNMEPAHINLIDKTA